jgi:hypothetical protein
MSATVTPEIVKETVEIIVGTNSGKNRRFLAFLCPNGAGSIISILGWNLSLPVFRAIILYWSIGGFSSNVLLLKLIVIVLLRIRKNIF